MGKGGWLVWGGVWILMTFGSTYAQSLDTYLGDEAVLYAETKQVNQFLRRFNGEEDIKGKRLSVKDSLYRNPRWRIDWLHQLYDHKHPDLREGQMEEFIRSVVLDTPRFLDFHGGNWFAEVHTTFRYQRRSHPVTLFLTLEKASVGSKWVFSNVYFEPFTDLFSHEIDSAAYPAFIHPMSHELDFMNLIKVFRQEQQLERFTERAFQPDYLTLFLYELKKGNLHFEKVSDVSFHFFQIDGWYFQLQEYNRRGMNRGWLISQLTRIPEGQEELLLNYIYRF